MKILVMFLASVLVGVTTLRTYACREEAQHPSIRATGAVTQIILTNSGTMCTQKVNGVAYQYVPVPVGNSVQWIGPTPGIEIVFGPFDDYYSSTTTVTAGATVGRTNVNHPYDSVMLGSTQCDFSSSPMGLIMKP